MTLLRTIAVVLSLMVHGSLGYGMWQHARSPRLDSFDAGSGNDSFTVELGIGIDGIVKLGEDIETIHAAEVTPVEMVPTPPVPEEKPIEDLRDAITSTAVTAIEDNIVKTEEPPPPVTEPEKPKQVQALVQPMQLALAKDASTGREQTASGASALNEYLGQLTKLFEASKFQPKKRAIGRVEIEIAIGTDGHLVSRKVKTSSGIQLLDDTALEIVDRAAEKVSTIMPSGLLTQELSTTLPFIFR